MRGHRDKKHLCPTYVPVKEENLVLGDKFNLTKAENLFLAKKTIVENIYHSARLEGCNVTFSETKTILDGVSVGGLDMDDVQVILNLRDAWKFTLKSIEDPFDLDFACKINTFVARNQSLDWGVLRDGNVGISGVDYVPIIPVEKDVRKTIGKIQSLDSTTEKALTFYLWAMRSQLFWDGNKRTSNICANKILIADGKGILTIQEKHLGEFNALLTGYYNTNNDAIIKDFLYEKCLYGIDFGADH